MRMPRGFTHTVEPVAANNGKHIRMRSVVRCPHGNSLKMLDRTTNEDAFRQMVKSCLRCRQEFVESESA